jgi:3-hydroxy acid dehydrogenase/malonic semialdehyde reductase
MTSTWHVVTGASSGIGRAVATRSVRDGHIVLALGRNEERLTALADELGPALHRLAVDITSMDLAELVVSALPADALV